jgi:hypothetical protein
VERGSNDASGALIRTSTWRGARCEREIHRLDDLDARMRRLATEAVE